MGKSVAQTQKDVKQKSNRFIKTKNLLQEWFIKYIVALFFTERKKNQTELAKTLNISHDGFSRLINSGELIEELITESQLALIKNLTKSGKIGNLIIDDTAIQKRHAKKMEGVGFVYDSTMPRDVVKGFVIVTLVWQCGTITIPIASMPYLKKNICTKYGKKYNTKIEIAQILTEKYSKDIKFEYFLMDSLYFSTGMTNFLNKNNIKFISKIRKNAVIFIKDDQKVQLQDYEPLTFSRNQRKRTATVTYKENVLHITARREKNRWGEWQVIYLVSNEMLDPERTIALYKERWAIETVFRCVKQNLGIKDCQSRKLSHQYHHINLVMFAYGILSYEKNKRKIQNVESFLRELKTWSLDDVMTFVTNFLNEIKSESS